MSVFDEWANIISLERITSSGVFTLVSPALGLVRVLLTGQFLGLAIGVVRLSSTVHWLLAMIHSRVFLTGHITPWRKVRKGRVVRTVTRLIATRIPVATAIRIVRLVLAIAGRTSRVGLASAFR